MKSTSVQSCDPIGHGGIHGVSDGVDFDRCASAHVVHTRRKTDRVAHCEDVCAGSSCYADVHDDHFARCDGDRDDRGETVLSVHGVAHHKDDDLLRLGADLCGAT